MRGRRDISVGQLQLFDEPKAGGLTAVRRMRRRPRLRVPVTLLAIGVATAGMLAGSWAAWTSQATNPTNAVTAGTLTMTNSKNTQAVFTADDIKPGDSGSSTVTLTNSGSVPMSVRLTQDQVSSSGIEESLGLKVYDQTRNRCYWPVNQAGACPSFGAWNATATLNQLALPATSGAAQWPAGQAHTFEISWQLALTSPNSDQGKTGSFRLVWDGTQ